jgi:hypothetical protein
MPEGTPGTARLNVVKDSQTSTTRLLRLSTDSPVIAGDLQQVCKGDSFYDINGTEVEGLKDCPHLTEGPVAGLTCAPGELLVWNDQATEGQPGWQCSDSAPITDGFIASKHIAGGAIQSAQIAAEAVSSTNIQDGAVGKDQLGVGSVYASHMGEACPDNNVMKVIAGVWQCAPDDGSGLTNDSIQSIHIAAGQVGTTDLADGSITNVKIVDMDAGKLASGTIDHARFSAFSDLSAESKIGNGASQVAAGNHTHANATTLVDGFMSAGDKSRLDGIESSADVTDAANVAAAGAIMDTDSGTVTSTIIANGTIQNVDINDVAGTKVTQDATHRFVTDAEKTTWNGLTSSQWTTNGSDVHFNTGKVGIGSATPSSIFEIENSSGNTDMTIDTTNGNHAGIYFAEDDTPKWFLGKPTTPDDFILWNDTTNKVNLRVKGDDDVLIAENSGNVGIGTTPTAKLHVNGQVRIDGGSPAAGKILTSFDALGLATWETPDFADESLTVNAGVGLSGGGDLTADRTLNLDILGLTSGSTVDGADEIIVYDADGSGDKHRRMTRSDFLSGVGSTPAGANTEIQLNDAGSFGSDSKFVLSSGNLGVGITSPTSRIHAQNTGHVDIRAQTTSGASGSAGVVLEANSDRWRLLNDGSDSSFNLKYDNANSIPFKVDSAATNNALTIGSNSNVGIGTDSSSYKLSLYDSNHTLMQIRSGSASGDAGIILKNGSMEWNLYNWGAGNEEFVIADITHTKFPFKIEKNAATNSIYIKNGGNVGIGTSNPGQKLEVDGKARAEGLELKNNGSIITIEPVAGLTAPYSLKLPTSAPANGEVLRGTATAGVMEWAAAAADTSAVAKGCGTGSFLDGGDTCVSDSTIVANGMDGATVYNTGGITTNNQNAMTISSYGPGTGTGELTFNDLNDSDRVIIKAPDNVSTYTLQLPSSIGTVGDTLVLDNSGQLDFRRLMFSDQVLACSVTAHHNRGWYVNGELFACHYASGSDNHIYKIAMKKVPKKHTLFISERVVRGDEIYGFISADLICQNAASNADLPEPSSFKAILSSGSINARNRIKINGAIYNTLAPTPEKIADSEADFWNGFLDLDHSIRLNEYGLVPSETEVWTGTDEDGLSTGFNCSSWTVNSIGTYADGTAVNGARMDTGTGGCHGERSLYCINQ